MSHALRTPAQAEIHQKIVKGAALRARAEGINGAAVSAVMRDAGLTHGGFYKHFETKDELLMESLSEAFEEIADRLGQVAEKSQPGTTWQTIVKTLLSPEHCGIRVFWSLPPNNQIHTLPLRRRPPETFPGSGAS